MLELDVSNFEKGMYLIGVRTDEKVLVK